MLDADRQMLESRVSALFGWEKRKRREQTLLTAMCVALLVALAVPLFVALPRPWAWSTPLALFALIAPVFLFARRWRECDATRSLAAFDKALGASERVTTAWELAQRNDSRAVALLVLRQACERVTRADAQSLFPRRWHKRRFLVVPLFALWLGLHMFEARFGHDAAVPAVPAALARELRDFARHLLEKARAEALPKTVEAARELEQLAQRGIDANTADSVFQREVAEAHQVIAARARDAGQASGIRDASQRQLEDMKAELQAARDWLATPDTASQSPEALLNRLTQLRKHGEWRRDQEGRKLSRDEMQAFLDKLEKRVAAALDRRALQQAERRLRQFAQRRPGEAGGWRPGSGGRAERDDTIERMPEGEPSAPGGKPGTASGNKQPPSEFEVGSRASAKGAIGAGESSSILLKGRPSAGRSAVVEDAVVARYRRRAEAELDAEHIPGELKDAIRSYFLSLDESK